MAKTNKYEVNPLLLKAIWEKCPTPGLEEAAEEFKKMHKPVQKSWKPAFKIPSVQISKIYLNATIVAVFSILFTYLVFYRGFSLQSEKGNENSGFIRKVSSVSSSSSSSSSRDPLPSSAPTPVPSSASISSVPVKDTTATSSVSSATTIVFPSERSVQHSPDAVSDKKPEPPPPQNSSVPEENLSGIQDTLSGVDITTKKNKKRKKRKNIEAEILDNSEKGNILLPGTFNQEEPEIRP